MTEWVLRAVQVVQSASECLWLGNRASTLVSWGRRRSIRWLSFPRHRHPPSFYISLAIRGSSLCSVVRTEFQFPFYVFAKKITWMHILPVLLLRALLVLLRHHSSSILSARMYNLECNLGGYKRVCVLDLLWAR